MKNLFYILLIFSIVFNCLTFSQDLPCGTESIGEEDIDLEQLGGIYLTSQGNLKVLVVFARFKDDTDPHTYWPVPPVGQGHPINPAYTTWIDPDMQTGTTQIENFTHYFKEMGGAGIFNVTGTSVSVETPNDKSYYGNPPNRFLATKEVLQQKVDPLINFAEFDNWTFNSDYIHTNQPDGSVDMIIMIWRGLQFGSWGGEASLGLCGGSFTVANGTKTVYTGYRGGFCNSPGSGVTVHYWGERSPKYSFHSAIHEVGHWLLGLPHPYGGGIDNHNVWGILWSSSFGLCANAYERERLAWIYPVEITEDVINAPFTDYVTTGTAYKYHPPNGSTNEYYYFENHQRLNVYDDVTNNSNDKGIFIIHQQGPYNNSNNIRVKTSNGQWNWENPFNTICWNVTVPAFKPVSINRAGYNNRDKIPKSGAGTEWLFALINNQGEAVCGDWLHGGGLNNTFNLAYNDVFSPYSNPYSHTWSNQQNNFTMEIFNQSGSVVNAKFYLTNPLAGKPSKPQHVRVAVNAQHKPVVTWEANNETDLVGGHYKVWRAFTSGGEPTTFHQVATINIGSVGERGPATYSWTDFEICYAGSGSHKVFYTVSVVDNSALESIRADYDWVPWQPYFCKSGQSYEKTVVTEYQLYNNYPNPFNPVTTIQYDLRESGFVQLKIFDILGKEVADLVNEIKEQGRHYITFDAENLPSGVYVYSLRVNDFVSNRKMTILK
jgi:hypothetical protein